VRRSPGPAWGRAYDHGMWVWWRGRRERRRLAGLARAVEVREWRAYLEWVERVGVEARARAGRGSEW
jgi:hypothetical protein